MPNHVLIVVQTSPLPTPPEVIQKLVSVADQLAENATAAVFRRHLATREVGRLLQDMEDRARELQRGWDAEAEQMAQVCTAAAAQAGLELKLAEIGLGGDPIEELTALARSHDYSVLPIGPTVERIRCASRVAPRRRPTCRAHSGPAAFNVRYAVGTRRRRLDAERQGGPRTQRRHTAVT